MCLVQPEVAHSFRSKQLTFIASSLANKLQKLTLLANTLSAKAKLPLSRDKPFLISFYHIRFLHV